MMGHPVRFAVGSLALVVLAGCGGGGGGDGTMPPPQVASVAITSPSTGPTFATLGRTAQLVAEARNSSGTAISGVTISWSSSDNAVATVSGSGLVTAAANGAAQIRASASGVQSSPLAVTVSQVAGSVTITPASVILGAIGSTRQLAAAVRDSGGSSIAGASITWTRAGPGTVASVSGSGLVTSLANGSGDSAVATSGPISAKAPIAVSQVVLSVAVSAPAGDSVLRTTGSTRQFTATPRDSNGNTVESATVTWASNNTAVATVSPTSGSSTTATAVGDGTGRIDATSGGVTGSRNQVVQRYAATFTLSPTSATISMQGGTVTLNATAQDSASVSLTISWTSRNTAIVTVSAATGAATSAGAAANVFTGSAYVVASAGTRRDSALITVNIPVTLSGNVQPIFTQSCAISGCHTGAAPAGSMNLSSGQTFANTVNVPTSGGPPGSIRVIPNDPSNSYLIRKLEGGPNILGNRMPETGCCLSQTTVNIIRTWIAQGALNN